MMIGAIAMAVADIGRLLNKVGNILAIDTAYPLDGTFLYVEAAPDMRVAIILKDAGDRLVHRLPTAELKEMLFKLWKAEVPDKRWTAMSYKIESAQFDVSFSFDPIDPTESPIARRRAILSQRYGNKPIVYLPI